MDLAITQPGNRHRLVAALAAAAVQALLLWGLISGLTVHMPAVVQEGLKMFGVAPEPPPPPPEPPPPPRHTSSKPKGTPSPPNLRSQATPVVAPKPVVVMPVPPVIVVSEKPAQGFQATSGASDIAGPGTGAGGIGNGNGGGGNGDGIGPRWKSGRIKDSDYPGDVGAAGGNGTVSVRYLVDVDGRVKECDIARSSGNPTLDRTTCGLIQKRFRFHPSRDGAGRPVPAWIVEDHTWVVERDPNPPPEEN